MGLSDYVFGSAMGASQIECIDFSVSPGEVCAIEAPNPDDGRVLLKALATLVRPMRGLFTFLDKNRDLNNHREVLSCKQKIGYAARDASLISNLKVSLDNIQLASGNLSRNAADIDAGKGLLGALIKSGSLLNQVEASITQLSDILLSIQRAAAQTPRTMELLQENLSVF